MNDNHRSQYDPTRRDLLRTFGGAMAAGAATPLLAGEGLAASEPAAPRIAPRFALSDRAIGLRQGLAVFDVARDAGFDGAEVDLGRLGSRGDMMNRLALPYGRRQFTAAAAATGVGISSIAATCFATQSFLNHRMADDILDDWLTALVRTGTRTGVLAFGVACDLTDADVYEQSIERLKPLGDRAAADGLVIALDTPLSAVDLAALLHAIGSSAVQGCVRLDANAADAVSIIGANRVTQLRCRDGESIGESAAPALPSDWPGWIVIERIQQNDGSVINDCSAAVRRAHALTGWPRV